MKSKQYLTSQGKTIYCSMDENKGIVDSIFGFYVDFLPPAEQRFVEVDLLRNLNLEYKERPSSVITDTFILNELKDSSSNLCPK